MTTILGSDER